MKYEFFEMVFENWSAFQSAIHTLPDSHPMKTYCKNLFDKINELPIEKQEEYFNEYYKRNRY